VRKEQLGVDLDAAPQPSAGGAGAEVAVEAEVPRGELFGEHRAMGGAERTARELDRRALAPGQECARALAPAVGVGHRLGDAFAGLTGGVKAINDEPAALHRASSARCAGDQLLKIDRGAAGHRALPNPRVAAAEQILGRRVSGDLGQQPARAGGQARELAGCHRGRARLEVHPALGTVGPADPREEDAQRVIDLGGRRHGGPGVVPPVALVDGDGGREALGQVEGWALHAPEEAAGVGAQ
jgi:hypothetical protein